MTSKTSEQKDKIQITRQIQKWTNSKIPKITLSTKKIQYLQSTTIILPRIENLEKTLEIENKLGKKLENSNRNPNKNGNQNEILGINLKQENDENTDSNAILEENFQLNSNSNLNANSENTLENNEKIEKTESQIKNENTENVKNENRNYQINLEINHEPNFEVLNDFYEKSQVLWSDFSPRIRRYTRKILKELEQKKFQIQTQKTEESWRDFYDLHIETAQRQNFPTQSKAYLHELFWQNFTRIIIIKNSKGETESVFLGILQTDLASDLPTNSASNPTTINSNLEPDLQKDLRINLQNNSNNSEKSQTGNIKTLEKLNKKNTNSNKILTYLLGGNSQTALNNHTQYLLQLTALWLCYGEKCDFYDMGGWEEGTGYSEFKNGYRGNLQTFFGAFDFVLKPINYDLINFAIHSIKKIRSFVKR